MQESTVLMHRVPAVVSLSLVMVFWSVSALADIVAESGGPQVTQNEHQAARIDIQAPNADGVSHNVYQRFDVDREGAVFNNSRDGARSELAGQLPGNPNLRERGPASTILNEVHSPDPSMLRGMMEVAGSRADVIVANPSGITCSGCGFINSDRGVLTTGSPIMENGRLKGFDVDRGRIEIRGKGLDGRGQKYTDLIARTVVLNGKVQADNARIITGRNQVNAASPEEGILSKAKKRRPARVALDVKGLGSMYANRIYIVGTEEGVGVRIRENGELGGGKGSITLANNGRIENEGHIDAGRTVSIDTHGHEFDNAHGQLDTSILNVDTHGGAINNYQGRIEAGEHTTITSGDVNNTKGKLSAPESLTLNTNGIHNQAGLISGGRIDIDTHGHEFLNRDGDVDQANPMAVTRGVSGGTVSIVAGSIDNAGGRIGARRLSLNTTQYANGHACGDNAFVNVDGRIDAERNLSIDGRNDTLYNEDGVITSGGAMSLTLNTLENDNGAIRAGQKLSLNIDDYVSNEDGEIRSGTQPERPRPLPISMQ